MFRNPQILTWSCSSRPLRLLRKSQVAACSEPVGTGCWDARAAKERKYEAIHECKEGSLFPKETLSCSAWQPVFNTDCETSFQNLTPKAVMCSYHHDSPQVSAAVQAKPAPDSWKCTAMEDLSQKFKAVSTYQNCLLNTTRLQLGRRHWDVCQPSLSLASKIQYNLLQSQSCHREHFVRAFSLSTHQPWNLNHLKLSSASFHQTRAGYEAAPRAVCSWRDCLSLENENRCRQSLGPNLKLYEMDKGRKGASLSQTKKQAKWASVLVSLCSVAGEPAFLFTLRSSTLKGRHKGDVRWVAGTKQTPLLVKMKTRALDSSWFIITCSFAGGKSDPSDRDVVATALREAREELGINVTVEKVWGILKPLRDMVRASAVMCKSQSNVDVHKHT